MFGAFARRPEAGLLIVWALVLASACAADPRSEAERFIQAPNAALAAEHLVDPTVLARLTRLGSSFPLARAETRLGPASPAGDGSGAWIVPVRDSALGAPGTTIMLRVRVEPTHSRVDLAASLADPDGSLLRLSRTDSIEAGLMARLIRVRNAQLQYARRFERTPGDWQELLRIVPTLDFDPERYEWRSRPGTDRFGRSALIIEARQRQSGREPSPGDWFQLGADGSIRRLEQSTP